jgi:hypothetical protein
MGVLLWVARKRMTKCVSAPGAADRSRSFASDVPDKRRATAPHA